MKPARFDYFRPRTLADAVRALGDSTDGAAAIAGGQSLLPMLNLRMTQIGRLIDIGRLPELRKNTASDCAVRIGAATTHAEIEDECAPDPGCGLMSRVAAQIAYRAIRNQGTIGGSVALADPAADWPACLVALDASAILVSPRGERREPVAELLRDTYTTSLAPDEIIVSFEIPRLEQGARASFVKVARKSGAFAMSLAFAIFHRNRDGRGCRANVVLAGAGGKARRLPHVCTSLEERVDASDNSLLEAVAADISGDLPIGDAYALRLHGATVLRAIAQARPR